MDFDSLKAQVSNLTLYDLKAGVRKVQNGTLIPKLARECIGTDRARSCHEPHGDGVYGQRSHQRRPLGRT